MGNKHPMSGLLGVIVRGATHTSTPWFQDPLILDRGEIEPGIGLQFKEHSLIWHPVKQKPILSGCCFATSIITESPKPFHLSIRPAAPRWCSMCKTSSFHRQAPIITLPLLWNQCLDQMQCYVEESTDGYAGMSTMGREGKPYPENVSVPVKVNLFPSAMKDDQDNQPATAGWLAGPQRTASYRGLNLGLCWRQVRHSALVSLVRASSCHWAHAWFPPLPLCSWAAMDWIVSLSTNLLKP